MKKVFFSLLLLSFVIVFVSGCGGSSPVVKAPPRPDVQYTVLSTDAPKSDPSAWAPGSKRQITYTVKMAPGTTEEQVKKVGEFLIETDAKLLKSWNVAFLKFVVADTASAFATGTFTKNGKVPDGNQVKPGQYEGFTWDWKYYKTP